MEGMMEVTVKCKTCDVELVALACPDDVDTVRAELQAHALSQDRWNMLTPMQRLDELEQKWA